MAGGAKQSRRGKEPRHIRLYHSVTGCAAWRDLSGNAVKLLIALLRLDKGGDNGQLFMSVRTAAEAIGVSKGTAQKLLTELDKHGFIKPVERGYFQIKGGPATSWRVTWQAAPGTPPTRDFEKWEPDGNKSRYQNLSGTVPKIGTLMETFPTTVSKIGTAFTETSHFSNHATVPKTGTQIVSHGQSENNGHPLTGNSDGNIGGPINGAGAGFANQKGKSQTDADVESQIRDRLKSLLQLSPTGTQSRLAEAAKIPGGTLSKFLNDGKGLSSAHRVRLQLEMANLEKSAGASRAA